MLLRKRLHRHIENCDTCTKRRAFELRPAAFFGPPPLVAVAGALRMFTMPAAVKAKVFILVTGTGTADAARRAAILRHAGSFSHQGFPHAAHAAHAAKAGALHGAGAKAGAFLKTPQGQGTAAAVAVAVVAASTAFALSGNSEHVTLSDARPGHSNGGGSGGAGSGGGGGGAGGGGTGTVTVSPGAGSLAPGKSATVTVTTTSSTAVGQAITLAPGGTTWTVLFGSGNSATGGALPGLGILPSPAPLPSVSPSCTVYTILPNGSCP